MTHGYPLSVDDQRTLPDGYDGPVFVWDVDKTYLATRFSSLKGVGRIPFEFAVDKHAIPGMPEVLRGLRRGPGPGVACAPLFFVTASPPLLRGVLERKMLMDGVEYDGITFKDWARTLKAGRPGRLREQMGFKLSALLDGRQRRVMATEYLFGDDVEKDAEAFHLYAQLLHGEISAGDAQQRMAAAGVSRDDRQSVFSLIHKLPDKRGKVDRIFIHLEHKTPPARFEALGEHVTPVRNAFQLSLALFDLGLVDSQTVQQADKALFSRQDLPRADRDEQIEDAIDRGLITTERATAIDLLAPL